MTPADILAVIITLTASVIDIKTKKIPNWLTFGGAAVGILCQWWQWRDNGMFGLAWGVMGWVLAVALMLGTRVLAQVMKVGDKIQPVGFGDVKLIAAVGACFGPQKFLCQFFLFSIIFGIFAIMKLVVAVPWKRLSALLSGIPIDSLILPSEKSLLNQILQTPVPLAPFVAAATICTVFLYTPIMHVVGSGI